MSTEPTDVNARRERARRVLEEQIDSLPARLLLHAQRKLRNKDRARDFVQETCLKVIDPEKKPWDEAKQPKLEYFMGSILNRSIANARAKERVRRAAGEVDVELPDAPDPTMSPEDALIARERFERCQAKLGESLSDSPVARRLFQLMLEGHGWPKEQAVITGYAIEEIRNARKLLERHVAGVLRELSSSKMRAARRA